MRGVRFLQDAMVVGALFGLWLVATLGFFGIGPWKRGLP